MLPVESHNFVPICLPLMPRKPASTNLANLTDLVRGCPLTFTFSVLGNRWRPVILWKTYEGCQTPAELRRAIPIISKKMLYEGLLQLCESGLITKNIAHNGNGRYVVTPLGASLRPMLEQAWLWGERHADQSVGK